MRRIAVAAVILLATAACGVPETDQTTGPVESTAVLSSGPTTVPTAGPSEATASQDGPVGSEAIARPTTAPERFPVEASTDPVVSPDFPGGAGGVAYLERVRAGRHPGYDRVVWEFDGPAPSFRAEYATAPVTESGSGRPVDVEGDGALSVIFSLASGVDLSGTEPVEIYTGPTRIGAEDAGTRNVTEVVETGDFENTLAWAVGVEEVTPFTVTVLSSPTRVVLDIAR